MRDYLEGLAIGFGATLFFAFIAFIVLTVMY
jgi:hypothetical protein